MQDKSALRPKPLFLDPELASEPTLHVFDHRFQTDSAQTDRRRAIRSGKFIGVWGSLSLRLLDARTQTRSALLDDPAS